MPYYFLKVTKKKSRNLDVWAYNNMGKNSPKPGKDVPYHGEITGVRSVHFTWCQKPWKCHVQQTDVCLASLRNAHGTSSTKQGPVYSQLVTVDESPASWYSGGDRWETQSLQNQAPLYQESRVEAFCFAMRLA